MMILSLSEISKYHFRFAEKLMEMQLVSSKDDYCIKYNVKYRNIITSCSGKTKSLMVLVKVSFSESNNKISFDTGKMKMCI